MAMSFNSIPPWEMDEMRSRMAQEIDREKRSLKDETQQMKAQIYGDFGPPQQSSAPKAAPKPAVHLNKKLLLTKGIA